MSRRKNYISLPDHARRDFIKWTIGLGAALGLRPWKVFEVQESIVGPAVADSAACSSVNRFVGFVCGNGGHAWNTQLWPHDVQATTAGASFYATGKATPQAVGAGDHKMFLAPDAPKFMGKKMTGFVCGTNLTHTNTPSAVTTVATGVSMFAAAAALQTASPTLVPAISITNIGYGTAAGAPAVASVPTAAGMVDLFNSASSTAGGALANASDAALFEAYYKANLSLHSAAALPTMTSGLATGKVAANLLGKNLASQLKPTNDDLTRYGLNVAGVPAKITSIGTALITAVKAFQLNLTSHVMMPVFQDDPHGAFQNMATLTSTVQQYGKVLDAFMADCMAIADPMCAGRKIGDNLVMAWSGDTTKDAENPNGWPDGTRNNHNVLYVMGNGFTKAGWFGGIKTAGTLSTWDPTTGADVATGGMTSAALAAPASAAVLFAVAKGDARRVQDFYRGAAITGITNAVNM